MPSTVKSHTIQPPLTLNQHGGPRQSSVAEKRGSGTTTEQVRVLALKIAFDFNNAEDRELYNRIRDLSWQDAHYRNFQSRATWAEAFGCRHESSPKEKTGISKIVRDQHKGELSGVAYGAAETEVKGAWSRDGRKILAGQPLPEWKPTAALSIRGHKDRDKSGVRLVSENDHYVLYLQCQTEKASFSGYRRKGIQFIKQETGGSWLRLCVAKNTKRDEFQGPLLEAMLTWTVPIHRATIQMKAQKHAVIVRLTYRKPVSLPALGERVATLALDRERLLLRTETQTHDYTYKLVLLKEKKQQWDLIRRRVTAQIGWRKGHARLKRQRLAKISWDDWRDTYIHQWTAAIAKWSSSQGVGTMKVGPIDDGDWPAYQFVQRLTYKLADLGIAVEKQANIQDASGERTAKAAINKQSRRIKKRREAITELTHQLKG